MSTAPVSSSSISQELQAFYQTRQSDVKQLGSALQSGDVNGAQQAYDALAALGQSGPFANSEPFSKSSRAQAFEAIGADLQAGDLSAAQASFAALTGNPSNPPLAPSTVVNLTSTQPASTTTASTTPTDTAPSIYQQLQAYRQQRQTDLTQLGQDLQAGNVDAAQTDFNTLTTLGQTGPNNKGQTFSGADRNQDFLAIGQVLQSGDLAGAQSAFATLASTFTGQNPQAQTAINTYNPGSVEIVINLNSPPSSGTAAPIPAPSQPPIVVNSPEPIDPAPVVSPVVQPPVVSPVVQAPVASPIIQSTPPVAPSTTTATSATPEIVINLEEGSGSSSTPPTGQEEITINLGSGGAGAQITIDDTAQAQTGSSPAEQVTIDLNNSAQASTPSSAPAEGITINLGSGSSGSQITIDDTAQGQNPSPTNPSSQTTINLNPQNNYQLILNLLNSNSTSGTANTLSISA